MREVSGRLGEVVKRDTAPVSARSLTSVRIAAQADTTCRAAGLIGEKWRARHDLTAVLTGVSLSAATAREALLICLAETVLALDPGSDTNVVVFPSDTWLAARARGVSEASVRRYLSALREASLVILKRQERIKSLCGSLRAPSEPEHAGTHSPGPVLQVFSHGTTSSTAGIVKRELESLAPAAINLNALPPPPLLIKTAAIEIAVSELARFDEDQTLACAAPRMSTRQPAAERDQAVQMPSDGVRSAGRVPERKAGPPVPPHESLRSSLCQA